MKELSDYLFQNYNINFKNHDLLGEAFTQASYVNEHPKLKLKNYERLEFLGDAILQKMVSAYIFELYPKFPQGKLTNLRAAMVCADSFSFLSLECNFDKYVRLGRGENTDSHRRRKSLMCDIFESFIGPFI